MDARSEELLEMATNMARRIRDLEAALRPFAETYRFIQPMGSMRKEFEASLTCGKFTVQDLARAAELVQS